MFYLKISFYWCDSIVFIGVKIIVQHSRGWSISMPLCCGEILQNKNLCFPFCWSNSITVKCNIEQDQASDDLFSCFRMSEIYILFHVMKSVMVCLDIFSYLFVSSISIHGFINRFHVIEESNIGDRHTYITYMWLWS